MTLEELEIIVKADISDATNKLNELKSQLENKAQVTAKKVAEQVKPSVETISETITASGNVASRELDIINRKIGLQQQKVNELKAKMKDYYDYMDAQQKLTSGKLGAQEYVDLYSQFVGKEMPKDYTSQLESAEIQLEKLQLQADKTKNKLAGVGTTAEKSSEKIDKSMKKASKSIQSTEKHSSKLLSTLTRMVRYRLVHAIISSARQGFQDLAVFSSQFNQAMSDIQGSFIQVRNSIATALAPALEQLAPVIVKIAEAISWLFTEIAMWSSAFAGKSTFVRAKKVTTDYAQSLGKATNEQKKANAEQKKMLAGFDELNVLMEQTSASLNSNGLPTAQDMFEEVDIPADVIEKANFIKEKLQELLPLLEAIGVIIAGYKLGELFGLWGKGKDLVDDLVDSFTNKNNAMGDQQEEYAKEFAWLKALVPAFGTSAVSVTALSDALKDLKNNPIEMPSLQPVKDMETAFDNAKTNVNTSMEGIKEGVTTNITELVPVIDTAVQSAGDTVVDGLTRAETQTQTTTQNVTADLNKAVNDATKVIADGIATQDSTVEDGFKNMENNAENLSYNIQKSIKTFIDNTTKNIRHWITYVINPALAVMEAMNSAGDEEIFNTSAIKSAIKGAKTSFETIDKNIVPAMRYALNQAGKYVGSEVSKAVEPIGNAVKGAGNYLNENIVTPFVDSAKELGEWASTRGEVYERLKRDMPEVFPDWGKVGQTIVGGVGLGSGLGLTYSATTGDTSLFEQMAQLFENYLPQVVPAFASGGVVSKPTLALVGEGASSEVVAPQDMLLEMGQRANIPVMNSIEEMGDKLVQALNNIGVYAEFDYSKLKVGLDNENYRVGGKLYGV